MIEHVQIQQIKAATIILERTNGDVLLCERSKKVNFFPGFFVFPGGKIDDSLDDNWVGDEDEVVGTVIRELYEEVGILGSSNRTIPSKDRSYEDFEELKNHSKVQGYGKELTFIGRKITPPFRKRIFDTAYFICSKEFVDYQEPEPDGEELVSLQWIQPKDAVSKWENGELKLPPPTLHILRIMANNRDNLETLCLVETALPIGLQTKVEFTPGISAIPITSSTIPPFINTNLVIVESGKKCLIVDPGANQSSKDHLRHLLLALPSTPKVFITHSHTDHWEGLDVVNQVYPNAIVFGHADMLDRINTSLDTQAVYNESIMVGERELTAIHTPGHTDAHMSLFDKATETIIAGDHVVGWGSAVLSPNNGDMKQYFETCEKLIELEPKLIIPAHGPPNFNPIKLLKNYISHRLEREAAILSAIESGSHSLDDIVKVVYQDVPQAMWEFAKSNIILHVRKLVDENKTNVNFSFL
ncbi:MAG: MBL fold metallo-hydrolase [Candidatus Kariarchaeaceae archaeon]|jgi:glyoxylase-like metal-dependent hydrolase (beta-lactamase superfamily II)/8-oxo-dGTP pyrophosphatase MutT (NUDIX family)